MKKLIILSLVLFAAFSSMAQADTLKPYQKNKHLPDISLLNVDSVLFSTTKLAAGTDKKIILMLFSPDCDHCQKQLEEFISIKELPAKAELVMISVYPLQYNRDFYKKYKLDKYPFIHLGQDYKNFCIPFFIPHTVPVLAYYNKERQFTSIHQGNADKKQVLAALQD